VYDEIAQSSDASLVIAVGRQSIAALEELFRRHGGAVLGLARRVTNDAHRAEDVCQTVFTDLWWVPERYDPERGALRPWLLAQAHRRSVDIVRSETARRRRQERDAALSFPSLVVDDVEAVMDGEVLADEVRRALDRLPAAERDPILLAYYGEHSYRDAATLLGLPEGTVKSRIRSGLARLRRTLDFEGVRP
jgi:RNA polymerase sigma-70 factor (ECF subfamily)